MHKFIIKISFIHSSSYNLTNHMLGISAVVEDSKLAKGAGSDSILANGAPSTPFTSLSSSATSTTFLVLGSSTQVTFSSSLVKFSLSCNSMVLSVDSRTVVSFCSSVMSAVLSAVSSSIMVSSFSCSLFWSTIVNDIGGSFFLLLCFGFLFNYIGFWILN